MHMRLILALSLFVIPIGLSGCSGGGGAASAPKLMTFSDHQKEELAARGADIMDAAVDAVKGIPITGYAGEDFISSQDGLWNAGKEFDGLKIDVSGDAFSQGILGPPTKCSVEVRQQAGDNVKASSTVQFTTSGAGHYTALFPSVHCTRCISFEWIAPALRNGVSTTVVICAPADGSCPAITFNRGCAIQPALQHAVATPVEDQAAATTTATSTSAQDAAPKTQLEMGEQQSKSEQEERTAKEELEKEEKDSQ